MAARPIYTARLMRTSYLSEAAECKHLEFEVPELPHFAFTAGQFVSMLAPKDGKTITRAYSIASGPDGQNRFDLCLNRVEGGFFSNLLCDMREGEALQFHGPHGLFVLRGAPDRVRDCIFIATGTGIAPMRGFVQWLFSDPAHHQGRNIWLVFGTRYESDIYYRDFFESIAATHSNFHYIVTLSRATDSWKGRRGYVQERVREVLEAAPNAGRENTDAYICGLNDMVSATRQLLTDFGWDKKQIIFERYD